MKAEMLDDLIAMNASNVALEKISANSSSLTPETAIRLVLKAKLNLGRYAECEPLSRRLISHDPANPEVQRLTGYTNIALGRLHRGAAHFRRAAILNPLDPMNMVGCASAARHLTQAHLSQLYANRALRLDPLTAESYSARVSATMQIPGTEDINAHDLRRAILLKPWARSLYGLSVHLGKINKGLDQRTLEKLCILDPRDIENHYLLNLKRAEKVDSADAVNAIRRLMIITPQSPLGYSLHRSRQSWIHDFSEPLKLVKRLICFADDAKKVVLSASKLLNDNGATHHSRNILNYYNKIHDRNDPDILYNLCVSYRIDGDLVKAESIARKILNRYKSRRHGWLLVATLQCDMGDRAKAIRIMRKAVKTIPDDAQLWGTFGYLTLLDENYPLSITALRKSIFYNPTHATPYVALAKAYEGAGRDEIAPEIMEYGLRLADNSLDKITASAGLLNRAGRWSEALTRSKMAYLADPSDQMANDNLTTSLVNNEYIEEALVYAERFKMSSPNVAMAHAIHSTLVARAGDPAKATELVETALQRWPSSTRLMRAQMTIAVLNGTPERQHPFSQSIAYMQKTPGALAAHSMTELYIQKWGHGFDLYEFGLDQKRRGRGPRRTFRQPQWLGEPILDKTLLIHAEQGIGDELMFGTMIPDVLKLAGHAVIEVSDRLKPLYERSFPDAEIVSWKDKKHTETRTDIDYYTAVGSLGRLLRRSTKSFGRSRPYLEPDLDLAMKLRNRYSKHGDRLVIGVGWKGGTVAIRNKRRSVGLERLATILKPFDCTLVSIQYGPIEEEIREVNNKLGTDIIFDPEVDPLKSLDASAAQIAACDLVISSTNAGVHTAGALGIPCWALVPIEADWRWTWPRNDVVWYPGMRLYRQPVLYDWETPLKQIQHDLDAYLNGNPMDRDLRESPDPDWDWG
ncbi:MAG: hypothetical protein NXI18_03105 [Alphaproteobacteria bacterium]|nr:hypothetical protein [Alphaproteobacteria bacterium]